MYGANTNCRDLQEKQRSNCGEVRADNDSHIPHDFHRHTISDHDYNHVPHCTSNHHEHRMVNVRSRSMTSQHYALSALTHNHGC